MFMLCYYIWFHPTGIEMPFFKFLKRRKGGAGGGAGGPGGDAADGSGDSVPESVPLTLSKGGGNYTLEELRPSASSPDLVQDTCGEGGVCRGALRSSYKDTRRSSSMPPQSNLEFVGVRNFKYMGQKTPDSQQILGMPNHI